MTSSAIADVWYRVMREGLGYPRFGAHGSDIGAGVTTRLGWQHPDALTGIHLTAVGFPAPPQPWTPREREYQTAVQRWDDGEGAYSLLHATKPQTLACALNDSPAGLAAWITEKLRAWSDCGGQIESRFTRDYLLTNLTIYWATQTIGPSLLPYYGYRYHGGPLPPHARIRPPAGLAIFANEFAPRRAPTTGTRRAHLPRHPLGRIPPRRTLPRPGGTTAARRRHPAVLPATPQQTHMTGPYSRSPDRESGTRCHSGHSRPRG